MTDNEKIWDNRWESEFKVFKTLEEYRRTRGVVVRDLLKELNKTIIKLDIRNKHVADIGGGYGVMLSTLVDESNKKFLIEISESAIKIAREFYGIKNTYLIDLTENMFEKINYFDYVFCTEVLEHIHPLKIEKLLNNIHNILKPGGKIIITTPNVRSVTTFFLMLFGWSPFMFKMDRTHICPHTPKELISLMDKIGFKKNRVFTTKGLLFKNEKLYIHFPFRCNLGEHIIGVWEK